MKKFLVLTLTLTLVMGFSSLMFAGGCHTPTDPCFSKPKTIIITATNPLQGELTLPPTEDLGVFPCGDNKELEGNIPVTIRSNGYLKVTMDLKEAFRQYRLFGLLGYSELPTFARLKGSAGNSAAPSLVVKKDWEGSSVQSASYTMNPLNSGWRNKIRNYNLNVKTKTGMIEDQPDGRYTAKIKITIAAP